MTEPGPDRPVDHAPPVEAHQQPGVRAMVLGSLLAVLAPLAGFLGGSMVGDAGSAAGLSPLFLWMFVGLLVGGVGGVIAILGALRWTRTRHDNDSAQARAEQPADPPESHPVRRTTGPAPPSDP